MAMDQIILFAALGIVAGILGWGVLTMARGGEDNIKNSKPNISTIGFKPT